MSHTSEEMMAVAASRRLHDGTVCFVGIGLPSKAANASAGVMNPRHFRGVAFIWVARARR